jgi:hypothetical protein
MFLANICLSIGGSAQASEDSEITSQVLKEDPFRHDVMHAGAGDMKRFGQSRIELSRLDRWTPRQK